MGDVQKWLNKAAVKLGSTWGTEVAVGANDGLYPNNPGAPQTKIQMLEDEAYGQFQNFLLPGAYNAVDFTLDFDYAFEGNENLLLACLLGGDTASLVGTTLAYKHTMPLLSKSSLFVSYVTERLSKIYSVPSAKVLKATFGVNNGIIRSSFNLRGNKVIDDSAVNTSLSSVTAPGSTSHKTRFQNGVFRIANWSGTTPLGSSNKVYPKNFTIEIERSMDSEIVAGGVEILEPVDNDKPKVKVTLEFPRIDSGNQAYLQDWYNNTEKMMDITFTGSLIEGSSYYTLAFKFPKLVIEEVEYTDDKIIPAKVVLRGIYSSSAPAGMTGITMPVQVEVINTRSTDYDA